MIAILLSPKAFSNGGWGASGLLLIFSGTLSLITCLKLVETGLSLKIYSYPLVVEKVLGKRAGVFIEITSSLT